jgi:hypothetical protein
MTEPAFFLALILMIANLQKLSGLRDNRVLWESLGFHS